MRSRHLFAEIPQKLCQAAIDEFKRMAPSVVALLLAGALAFLLGSAQAFSVTVEPGTFLAQFYSTESCDTATEPPQYAQDNTTGNLNTCIGKSFGSLIKGVSVNCVNGDTQAELTAYSFSRCGGLFNLGKRTVDNDACINPAGALLL